MSPWTYFLTIQLFIVVAVSQRSPTISHISQVEIKDIGGVVDLQCSVQYAEDYPVLWVKVSETDSGLPISSGSSLIVKDSRFALRHDAASSTYTLQIKDIQETDAGTYRCQVILSVNNRISADVELQVRRAPIITDNSTRSIIVSEGVQVNLECYATGFPPPKVLWRKENNAILPTGGATHKGNQLKINSIKKEDRGTYYCVADNGVGRGAKRNIAVEVEFKPVIQVPRARMAQALQYDMDLECHIEAYPPPAISWIKDEVQLSNNQHYSISNFASADEFTDTTLRVITIEKRQYGIYTCKATNKLGSSEAQVELYESVIPVCPPACGRTSYGGASKVTYVSSVLMFGVFLNAIQRVLEA